MHESPPESRAKPSTPPKAANIGWTRPPFVYLGAIVLGLVLHLVWPLRIASPWLVRPIGAVVILLAVVLFRSAVRTFRAAGTPVPGNQPTTTIVHAGPYRFTRNPIYLAFSLFHLGVALCVNSLAMVITLVPAVAVMSFVVIPREERYLEAQFPSEYLSYKASVRRWV